MATLLPLSEVFSSLQGEGFYTGRYALFVRFVGCNLACPECFVGTTKVRMSDGTLKRIKDIKVGESVLSYNEGTHQFEFKNVVSINKREVDSVYRLQLKNSNKKIFVTGEHPFYVIGKGWVNATNLKENDTLFHFENYMSLFNPMKQKNVAAKASATIISRIKEGLIKPHRHSEETKIKSSDRMKQRNPMKNPITVLKNILAHKWGKTKYELEFERICDSLKIPYEYVGNNKLILGNRIPDYIIPNTKKLVEVYSSTFLYDGKYRDSDWIKEKKDHYKKFGYDCLCVDLDKKDHVAKEISEYVCNGLEVESITKIDRLSKTKSYTLLTRSKQKPIMVYNLNVEDNHTYFVDNILVHNCDTYLKRDNEKIAITIDALEQIIVEGEHRHIVVTGGEPLLRLEILRELKPMFEKHNLLVEVETNGIIPIPIDLYDWHFNISPKVWAKDKYDNLSMPPKCIYKFPTNKKNLQETIAFIEKFNLPAEKIYLMPMCKSYSQYVSSSQEILDVIKEKKWNFSTRLQIVHYFA
jgi:organic radical activating enzyme